MRKLQQTLESLVDRPQDKVIQKVAELGAQHASRRTYRSQKLGISPLATANYVSLELAPIHIEGMWGFALTRMFAALTVAIIGNGTL